MSAEDRARVWSTCLCYNVAAAYEQFDRFVRRGAVGRLCEGLRATRTEPWCFLRRLPEIRRLLLIARCAGGVSETATPPRAVSTMVVMALSRGVLAVSVYRIAHALYSIWASR